MSVSVTIPSGLEPPLTVKRLTSLSCIVRRAAVRLVVDVVVTRSVLITSVTTNSDSRTLSR